jgi:cytochrome c oxidase subunit 2
LISNHKDLELLKNNFFQGLGLGFSDSYFSFYIDWFHNFNYSLLLGVLSFVILVFFFLFFSSDYSKSMKVEYQWAELLCSIFPSFILLIQIVPSLGLLYFYGLMHNDSQFSLKVVGHQWYWRYDFRDVEGLDFDSYIKSLDLLVLGDIRQIDVDNRCVVPVDLSIRFCVSSGDVIHAWALNGLSIKLDAISGIISIFCYNFPLVGVFFGQCSEICGANHSFIPIVLEVSLFSLFKTWCVSILD